MEIKYHDLTAPVIKDEIIINEIVKLPDYISICFFYFSNVLDCNIIYIYILLNEHLFVFQFKSRISSFISIKKLSKEIFAYTILLYIIKSSKNNNLFIIECKMEKMY